MASISPAERHINGRFSGTTGRNPEAPQELDISFDNELKGRSL